MLKVIASASPTGIVIAIDNEVLYRDHHVTSNVKVCIINDMRDGAFTTADQYSVTGL